MGAELGVLSDYSVYEPTVEQDSTHFFSIQSAQHEDGRPASVFIHEDDESGSRTFAENEVKLLRRLRHPHIVKYLSSSSPTAEGPVQLVTEFVQPLNSIEADLHSMEIGVGLRCIVQALQFLHETCHISHNNVCHDAVLVAGSDRTWRLAGFALASKFESTSNLYLKSIAEFRDPDSIPPEDRGDASTSTKVSSCPHARDAWGLGSLVLTFADKLSSYGELEASLSESLLHPDPACRPTMKDHLSSSMFSNQLVKVLQFVNDITLKESKEKSAFFRGLPRRLQQIPASLVAQYLTSKLLSRFVLLEQSAREHVVPCLLVPQPNDARRSSSKSGSNATGIFGEVLYRQHIIPLLLKLFSVEDKHVRLVLLTYLHHYLPFLDTAMIKDRVLPHVLIGLHEDDDEIVAATFHALGDIVPVLGASIVVGLKSVSRFSSNTPRPSGGPQRFVQPSLRPSVSVGSPTPSSPSTSHHSSPRHAQAERPSCIRVEAKSSRGLQGQKEKSPKSPKQVHFSPENDFATTEDALRQSPTWNKMSRSGGFAASAANHLSNGFTPEADAAPLDRGHNSPRDSSTTSPVSNPPRANHSRSSQEEFSRWNNTTSQQSSSGTSALYNDDDAEDEPWEDFDDMSDADDGWGATASAAHEDGTGGAIRSGSSYDMAAKSGGAGAGAGDTKASGGGDDDGWNDNALGDSDDDWDLDDDISEPPSTSSSRATAAREPITSDWSVQQKKHSASAVPASGKSPELGTSKTSNIFSKSSPGPASPSAPSPTPSPPKAPAAKGLKLKSKPASPSSKSTAAAAPRSKPVEPPAPPPPVSAEDELLAMLEPDIKFTAKPAQSSGATASGISTSRSKSTAVSSPASSRSPLASVRASTSASPVPTAIAASPPATSAINFEYNADGDADADTGGWGDDDFEDF
ncbi:uncharacterized protein LOC135815058 [Sycon ciliatum]|uniref:uncharacterized protein LOC135815058 n=1 Tax=Sycon ciliatum TaxID=27933 RepID=UPI0031F60833